MSEIEWSERRNIEENTDQWKQMRSAPRSKERAKMIKEN